MSYTINTGKELVQAPRPVVLVDFTFPDGALLYVSSHNGDSANGGYAYGGHDYLPAINEEEIGQLAALSEQGIDRVPSVTLRLADPAAVFFTNYERGHGFKGADMLLRLVLHDSSDGSYSTDALYPFLGICDQPSSDDKNLSITARNRLDLTRYMLPSAPIQPNCIWINPVTVAQRGESSDSHSPYYRCGETRSLAAAPPCSYTKQTCTQPTRFSGSTWAGEVTGSGVNYLQGKESWRNADTSGKYKDYWPVWLGGKAWLACRPLNQVADGNYTRGEVAVGIGPVTVERVIVNGVELSQVNSGDFRWHYVNLGYRDGTPNGDRPYNGAGDPYGSLTVIQVLAPKSIISPDSEMNVQILGSRSTGEAVINIATASASGGLITITFGRSTQSSDPADGATVVIAGCSFGAANGAWIWRYITNDTYRLEGSSATGSGTGGTVSYTNRVAGSNAGGGASSPWVMAEALRQCGLPDDIIDGSTFASAAVVCDQSITFTDGSGASQTQSRYSTAIALRERRSVAEIVRGIRQSIGGLLVPAADGRQRLRIEGTLAEQQPAPVDGSNYNTAVTSTLRNGTATSGYLAYRFNRSNSWGLQRIGQPNSGTPNRISFPFQDPASGYAISNFSLIESDDVARVGQEFPGGLQVQPEGIASYNHALRCAKLGFAKIHRGNPAGDTRGTDWWQWTTSFRGCKLTVGDIVSQNDASKYSLTDEQIRIVEIRPTKDFKNITIKGHVHKDSWYLDSAANAADPAYQAKRRDRLTRPAFPWLPNVEAPNAGDPLYDVTDLSFALAPSYENLADGGVNVRLGIRGQLPVNLFNPLSVPAIGTQATITTTGGAIPGSITLYVAIVANLTNPAADHSTPSFAICKADIPGGTDTNQVDLPVYQWDASTYGYSVFAGENVNKLCWQYDDTGAPSTVNLDALSVGTRGMPDVELDRLLVRIKRAVNCGVWALACSAVTANTITFASAGLTPSDWIGYDLTQFAGTPGDDLPIRNYRVTGGSGDNFTVTPDPNTVIAAGTLFVMRSKPTIGSDGGGNYVDDGLWLNPLSNSGAGLTDDLSGMELRFIAGPGRGDSYTVKSNGTSKIYIEGEWKTTPTSASRYITAEPTWADQIVSRSYDVSDPGTEAIITADMNNLKDKSIVVQVVALDGGDNLGFESMAPVRDFFLAGSAGTAAAPPPTLQITANTTLAAMAQTVEMDSTSGDISATMAAFGDWLGLDIVFIKTSADANNCNVVAHSGETFNGASSHTLTAQWDTITVRATQA